MSATNAMSGANRRDPVYPQVQADAPETGQTVAVPRGTMGGTGPTPAVPVAGDQPAAGRGTAAPILPPPAAKSADGQTVGLEKIQVRMGDLGIGMAAASFEQIAQVLIESNKRNREATRMERQVYRDMDISAQKQAADDIRTQSWFSLAASAISSGFAIAGAVMQIKASAKALGDIQKAETAWRDGPTEQAMARESAILEEAGTKIQELNAKIASEATELPVKTQEVAQLKQNLQTERAALEAERAKNLPESEAKVSEISNKIGEMETKLQSAEAELDTLNQTHKQNKVDVAAQEEALQDKRNEYTSKNLRLADEGYARESRRIQPENQRAHAYGAVTTEIGKVIGALVNWKASSIEADKSEHMAEASKARSAAEDETDYMRAYMDIIRSAMDKLAAMQQAEADASRSIIRA